MESAKYERKKSRDISRGDTKFPKEDANRK